jgi:hypothetical protein
MELTGRSLVAAMCIGQLGNLLPHVTVPAIMVQSLMPLWGLSATEAGVMASALALGYMLTVPVLATLTDRIDARLVLAAGSAFRSQCDRLSIGPSSARPPLRPYCSCRFRRAHIGHQRQCSADPSRRDLGASFDGGIRPLSARRVVGRRSARRSRRSIKAVRMGSRIRTARLCYINGAARIVVVQSERAKADTGGLTPDGSNSPSVCPMTERHVKCCGQF